MFSFPCFLIQKVLFFTEKGYFESLPLFLLSLVWPPPFSISLSLSLSCSFLFSSLLSFFFAIFWFLVFVSFFPFLYYLLLFHERNNIKIFNYRVFHDQYLLFLGVSCLIKKNIFLSLFFFPDFKFCFCSTSMFLVSKTQVKNTILWSKGGLQQNFFGFMSLCFAKCEKLSFLAILGKSWMMFKKPYNNRYFSTVLKAKNKNDHFSNLLTGPSQSY